MKADRYQPLRDAIAAGPTPGPWVQDGDGVSAADEDVAVAMCCPSGAEAAFIAACDPDTIAALLADNDKLREALAAIVYWHDEGRSIDESWWEAARAALADGEEA